MFQRNLLFSKVWCDLVFEGRNKAYGAYHLRSQAGKRYQKAMIVVVFSFALLMGFYLFWGFYLHRLRAERASEAELSMMRQRIENLKNGYELKFLPTTKIVAQKRMAPGASEAVPELVSSLPKELVFGSDGPVAYDPEEIDASPLRDTLQAPKESLPLAKEKIVPTENVKAMPEFPGGPRAFMKWMDEHITYPSSCIKKEQEGLLHLSFIVHTDGFARDFEVENAFDPKVEKIVRRALKSMPQWKPGQNEQGEPTPVKISFDVDFRL